MQQYKQNNVLTPGKPMVWQQTVVDHGIPQHPGPL